jgi:hypothetical protein
MVVKDPTTTSRKLDEQVVDLLRLMVENQRKLNEYLRCLQ